MTDCGEGPLAQSWRNTDVRTRREESGFFVASEFSTVTDTGWVLHCARLDATTLSAECQQPCQPNAAESPKPRNPLCSNASRGIVGYSKEIPWIRCLGPCWLAAKGSPILRQLRAKGQMRRSHPRTRRRRDERPVNNPPTDNAPTGTRSSSVCSAGRPAASNPLTRVSPTLSSECHQPSNCRSETTSADSRMPHCWLRAKEENIENGTEMGFC